MPESLTFGRACRPLLLSRPVDAVTTRRRAVVEVEDHAAAHQVVREEARLHAGGVGLWGGGRVDDGSRVCTVHPSGREQESK